MLVCWRTGGGQAQSERGDGRIPAECREPGRPTPPPPVGLFRSASSCALTALHEQCLHVWARLFCTESPPSRNASSEGSVNVLAWDIPESPAPGESSLGARVKDVALRCPTQQGQVATATCWRSLSLLGAEQGKGRGERTRQREERCSERRRMLWSHPQHPFLQASTSARTRPPGERSHLGTDGERNRSNSAGLLLLTDLF